MNHSIPSSHSLSRFLSLLLFPVVRLVRMTHIVIRCCEARDDSRSSFTVSEFTTAREQIWSIEKSALRVCSGTATNCTNCYPRRNRTGSLIVPLTFNNSYFLLTLSSVYPHAPPPQLFYSFYFYHYVHYSVIDNFIPLILA